MPETTLSLRQLNRALLERQLLLERSALDIPAAVERLVGMQAQLASAPFVGLWTRLHGFDRETLKRLIDARVIVKATMMRATLHLVTAADYLRLRGAIQPMLDAAYESIAKGRGPTPAMSTILDLARDFMQDTPRSFAEITALFGEHFPDVDPGAMRYGVRTQLPLVQTPTDAPWSYPGNPNFTLAETWLGQPIPTDNDVQTLVRRYLAAFGPARVTDIQTWSGLSKLKDVVAELKPELVTYRDEQGVELFDLPDAPLPPEDTPAPVRFLPEFDNILLSHANRTRIVADAYRKQVYLPGLRVAATVLVDGFVQAAWKVDAKKTLATLTVEPFTPLRPTDRDAIADEAERLVRFVAPESRRHEVQVG